MRFLIDIAIAVVIAAAVGLGSAWLAVERGYLVGAITVGAWTAMPEIGGPDPDPYAIAMLARTGEIPLGAGEGIAFTATDDSGGRPLSGTCTYSVVGQTPAARLWTLTVTDGDGHLMTNAAHRTGFHSREIVRRDDGSFAIGIGSVVQPGNWLPITPVERFRLTFRLYDTPITTGSSLTELTMPRIERGSCA